MSTRIALNFISNEGPALTSIRTPLTFERASRAPMRYSFVLENRWRLSAIDDLHGVSRLQLKFKFATRNPDSRWTAYNLSFPLAPKPVSPPSRPPSASRGAVCHLENETTIVPAPPRRREIGTSDLIPVCSNDRRRRGACHLEASPFARSGASGPTVMQNRDTNLESRYDCHSQAGGLSPKGRRDESREGERDGRERGGFEKSNRVESTRFPTGDDADAAMIIFFVPPARPPPPSLPLSRRFS